VVRAPGTAGAASVVSVDGLVFPAATYGTDSDPLKQVDEAVQRMHETLARRGLGIGNMLQHTIYLKDGAAPPIAVLTRFHAMATKLAPSLKEFRSVGTIVRVPSFPDKNTAVMIDVVAGAPPVKGQPDGFKRIGFKFGPQEISETVAVEPLVFTAGLEAMDFQFGKLPPDIDTQIDVIVGKLHNALTAAGLDVGNMISHNLYVKRGTDPIHVIEKFHEAARKYSPGLKDRPSVGTLVIVDGMAGDGFLLEMDAIAVRPQQAGKPDQYARVPFTEMPMDIAKSVAVGDLVFLSGMEGVDFDKQGAVSPNVLNQVEVAVKKIDATLRKSGLTIGNMVKHKLYVKQGADVAQVRRKFHEVATRLAPELKAQPSAETLVIVEGLATNEMQFEASVIAARSK
jgi:enamine deaminase RidA (YjgF/YER057c/UK114 family)